jgi:beta-glucosidase
MIVRCFRPIAAALAAGLFVPMSLLAQQADTTSPASRSGEGWWRKRHEEKADAVKDSKAEVLFIGDSITQAWEGPGKAVWDRFYGPRKGFNIGFSGDRTQHVLWRLDNSEAEGIQPKVAVMMIGTNNMGGNTPEAIADGVKAIVAKLDTKLPNTKVLLLGIFPRSEKPSDAIREKVAATNDLIKPLADGKKVVYLDIGKSFLSEDGTLSKEIMPDFLHLTSKGYRIWADSIEPTLWDMMEGK